MKRKRTCRNRVGSNIFHGLNLYVFRWIYTLKKLSRYEDQRKIKALPESIIGTGDICEFRRQFAGKKLGQIEGSKEDEGEVAAEVLG